jgi:hypothetical protein
MKKQYIIGGLAVIGSVALVAYLLKPKAPRRNSEGFYNAVGKGISNRVPIASETTNILNLKAEIKMSINKLISYCSGKNPNPTIIFDNLNLIRLKIEEFYLKILFLELDESENIWNFNYLLLGINLQFPTGQWYLQQLPNYGQGLYGQLKLLNDVKRGASPFVKTSVLQFLNNLKLKFDQLSSGVN